MWLYYCILSTIIWGFVAIAIKKCSNNEPKRIAITGMLMYHSIILIFSIIMNPEILSKITIIDIIKMLPGIAIQSLGFYCSISAIKYSKVAVTTTIQKAQVIVTFALGVIVLQENCTILQFILSAILVILSIMVAKNKDNDKERVDKKIKQKAILYSYGVVIFYGISDFINKIYVTEYQDPLYVMFNYAVIIIMGILIYCILMKKWEYIDIRKINSKKYFILQSLLDVSSSIFDRFALIDGDVSVISVISTSSIVVTMLASRFILKEKISWKKYLMITGIFICVFGLAWIE